MKEAPDFSYRNEGSIVLLKPISEAAREWVADHLPDDAQWFGGSIVIEPRYFDPIAGGIESDGMSIAEGIYAAGAFAAAN